MLLLTCGHSVTQSQFVAERLLRNAGALDRGRGSNRFDQLKISVYLCAFIGLASSPGTHELVSSSIPPADRVGRCWRCLFIHLATIGGVYTIWSAGPCQGRCQQTCAGVYPKLPAKMPNDIEVTSQPSALVTFCTVERGRRVRESEPSGLSSWCNHASLVGHSGLLCYLPTACLRLTFFSLQLRRDGQERQPPTFHIVHGSGVLRMSHLIAAVQSRGTKVSGGAIFFC